ncbi:MAG: hypothetical protein KHY31_09675, partial [Clostridiales bacterium]|nr:hypothetical protein [Clostridiales bacterium]
ATYKVGVRVKDSSGTVVKKEIEGYKIENSLAIKKFTVNPSDGVNVGEKVSIKAEAEKGSGVYQYQFYVIRDEQEIIIRDYGSNGEFTWGPITPATYKVGVRVKDSSGTVIKKEKGQYTVSERTLKIKNFTSSIADVVKVGDSTVLSADVVNGVEPYEYKFYVVRDEQEILLRDFSKSNEYIWGPITPAEYEVHVMVRDAVGNIADEYIPITVERYKIEISEFKVGNNVEAYAGESVYISTKAKGGKGELTYRYYAIRNGQEIQLREDITGNIFIWGPVTPAQYEVCVEVQDSIGNKETATIPFEVKYTDFKITKFMMSKTGISYKGEPIVLSAAAEGGSGNYQYRFYVIRDGSEIVLQNYSTKTSYTWGPITPADYYVCVDVKDINTGTILTKILQITIELSVLNGIDVSEWQGTIDWKQVKNSGVDFAMLRILSGTMDNLTVDPTFYNNIRNATENGISVGVYRYGYAKNVSEARREANMVVNTLKSSGYSISYPVAYDVEDEAVQGKLSKAELTAIIKTFKSIIEENGYKFMIYANKNWLENKIDMSQFSQDDVWIAQYRDYTPNLGYQYNGPGNVTIWQYSSKGRVPGISGDVDMNVGYKRY